MPEQSEQTEKPVSVTDVLGRIFFETDKRVLGAGKYENSSQIVSTATGVLGATFNTMMHLIQTQPGYGVKNGLPKEALEKLSAMQFENLDEAARKEMNKIGQFLLGMLSDAGFRILLMSMISVYGAFVEQSSAHANVPQNTGGDAGAKG